MEVTKEEWNSNGIAAVEAKYKRTTAGRSARAPRRFWHFGV